MNNLKFLVISTQTKYAHREKIEEENRKMAEQGVTFVFVFTRTQKTDGLDCVTFNLNPLYRSELLKYLYMLKGEDEVNKRIEVIDGEIKMGENPSDWYFETFYNPYDLQSRLFEMIGDCWDLVTFNKKDTAEDRKKKQEYIKYFRAVEDEVRRLVEKEEEKKK